MLPIWARQLFRPASCTYFNHFLSRSHFSLSFVVPQYVVPLKVCDQCMLSFLELFLWSQLTPGWEPVTQRFFIGQGCRQGYPEMADKAEILELACYSFDNLSKLLVIQINDKCIISSVKIGQVLVTRSRKFDQMRLDYRQ